MLIVIKGMLRSDWVKKSYERKSSGEKLISSFAFLILLRFYLSCKMDTDWKSFIVSEIVSRTLCLAQTECGGCKDNNYCPLLHACQTTSLLRKFECFLHSRIKLGVHQDLESILNQFESRYILVDRREHYIESGKTLLNDLSPESLYYGRFITKYNDASICGPCFSPYISPPKATQELKYSSTHLDEVFVKSQLREACEDYDAMQTTPPQRAKQKERTAKPMLDVTNAMAYQPPKKKQKKAKKS